MPNAPSTTRLQCAVCHLALDLSQRGQPCPAQAHRQASRRSLGLASAMDTSRFPLRSQKALVTGASSGIGQAVALAFGRAGADVVVNYLTSPAAAESVVAEIACRGGKSFAHHADISEEN